MAIIFSRTLRSIKKSNFGTTLSMLCMLTVLSGIWAIWLYFANVSVIETSQEARLTTEGGIYNMHAPAPGTCRKLLINLGDKVRKGQQVLLFESKNNNQPPVILEAKENGIIADLADINPGDFIEKGAPIASILKNGPLVIEAYYPIDRAIGRIEKGQPATMRLDGFSWTQYGSLSCVVERVGAHSSNGKLKVVLKLVGQVPSGIPLKHGLSGRVEITVRHVSPLEMMMEEFGSRLNQNQTTTQAKAL